MKVSAAMAFSTAILISLQLGGPSILYPLSAFNYSTSNAETGF